MDSWSSMVIKGDKGKGSGWALLVHAVFVVNYAGSPGVLGCAL
jgi:hypothetical protein